jgi:hypothetical protein
MFLSFYTFHHEYSRISVARRTLAGIALAALATSQLAGSERTSCWPSLKIKPRPRQPEDLPSKVAKFMIKQVCVAFFSQIF